MSQRFRGSFSKVQLVGVSAEGLAGGSGARRPGGRAFSRRFAAPGFVGSGRAVPWWQMCQYHVDPR